MRTTFSPLADVWREVDQIRVPDDLEYRSLQLSSSGVAWHETPHIEDVPRAVALKLYRDMALTRTTDREILKFLRKGLAYGKHLMCTGNEATAVGAASALRPTDWVGMAVRDLGAWVARGVALDKLLAQACGRTGGLTGGWDGSLHMADRSARVLGLISHLGTFVPVAAGCAFAAQYKGTDGVALVFCGDGATSTGDFHEGLNIAAVLDLPLVIVIENNQWAFGTPTRLQYALPTLALRALAYGRTVQGHLVDGTNVLTVFDTVRQAVERARAGHGISIIETVSMRLEGHSIADPFTTYVPAEQLAMWHEKDPIRTFRSTLLAAGLVTADELDATDAGIAEEVTAAAVRGQAGHHLQIDDNDVLARGQPGRPTPPTRRGVRAALHERRRAVRCLPPARDRRRPGDRSHLDRIEQRALCRVRPIEVHGAAQRPRGDRPALPRGMDPARGAGAAVQGGDRLWQRGLPLPELGRLAQHVGSRRQHADPDGQRFGFPARVR